MGRYQTFSSASSSTTTTTTTTKIYPDVDVVDTDDDDYEEEVEDEEGDEEDEDEVETKESFLSTKTNDNNDSNNNNHDDTNNNPSDDPTNNNNNKNKNDDDHHWIRLSKLLSSSTNHPYVQNTKHTKHSLAVMSRRQAERLIRDGKVTYAGKKITTPHHWINVQDITSSSSSGILQVNGKAVVFKTNATPNNNNNNNNNDDDNNDDDNNDNDEKEENTKVWIVHKVKGEVVTEYDPSGRPSMMERLMRGGVGRYGNNNNNNNNNRHHHQQQQQPYQYHLKPIGRLDVMTEGLILVTNNGSYAREMELPSNAMHRTYRVRVHHGGSPLTEYKLRAIRRGVRVGPIKYSPMQIVVERGNGSGSGSSGGGGKRRGRQSSSSTTATSMSTNTWVRITCTEGKNRQVRNALQNLGCTSCYVCSFSLLAVCILCIEYWLF